MSNSNLSTDNRVLESCVNQGFWHSLASLKLDHLRVDDSPVSITGNNFFILTCNFSTLADIYLFIFLPGFYAPLCSRLSVPLSVVAESLPPEPTARPPLINGDRNKCCIPGTLYNTNTLESFVDEENRRS